MTGAGRIQVATVSGQGIQDMTRDGALMTKYMTRNSVVRTKTRDGVLRMEYSGHDHVSTRARNMRDRNLLAALCSTLANKKRSLCLPPSLCLSRFLSLSLFSSLPHTHTHTYRCTGRRSPRERSSSPSLPPSTSSSGTKPHTLKRRRISSTN